MSTLRPECRKARPGDGSVYLPPQTALFLIEQSIQRRRELIYGALHLGAFSCAIGAFFEDHPKAAIDQEMLDEVAMVNDSGGPKEDPHLRWKRVRSWLRFRLRALVAVTKP